MSKSYFGELGIKYPDSYFNSSFMNTNYTYPEYKLDQARSIYNSNQSNAYYNQSDPYGAVSSDNTEMKNNNNLDILADAHYGMKRMRNYGADREENDDEFRARIKETYYSSPNQNYNSQYSANSSSQETMLKLEQANKELQNKIMKLEQEIIDLKNDNDNLRIQNKALNRKMK